MDFILKLELPRHIAIVMDGNGRWAEQRGLIRFEGHRAGIHAVKTVIECCIHAEVPILSLFTFSRENWSRPDEEVSFLMELFLETFHQEIMHLHENNIRLRFTGERHGLSTKIQENMQYAEVLTANNTKLILNFAINYSGRWEITQAVKLLALDIQAQKITPNCINEQCFERYLQTTDLLFPDLFIRTSGERRISNFFLWQLAYTELYFTDVHWPDFSKDEFQKSLASYQARERRYGKTSQQLKVAEVLEC